MRNIYLVAYDISNDKARTKVFNKLKGYGTPLQFSLFQCIMSPTERVRLRNELWDLINHGTDRILLIDLGPDQGRGRAALEAWGKAIEDTAAHDGTLVV